MSDHGHDHDASASPLGIEVEPVERFYEANVAGYQGPLSFELIAGGHSNLTYRVTDAAGAQTVLRRPPVSHVLATAHDMGREWRAISGLQDTNVPVPPSVAFEPTGEVTGAHFYVTRFVDGYVMHDIEPTAQLGVELRHKSGIHLYEVLAELHALDPDAVGLGGHGKREGYVERQLRRWYQQYVDSKDLGVDVPDVDECYARLLPTIPAQQRSTIVHGDYRLGNCITGFDGTIAAVLDWEISTLGDPLADLAYTLNSHVRPGDPTEELDGRIAPTMAEGYPETDEVIKAYAARSTLDLSRLGWYRAFNHFKTACILQGVLARYVGGARGDASGVDLDGFRHTIRAKSATALHMLADA